MSFWKSALKVNRRISRKIRRAVHLTSKNKLGKSLKRMQHMFGGNNSAQTIALSNGASYNYGAGYYHSPRTLSQMTGGY